MEISRPHLSFDISKQMIKVLQELSGHSRDDVLLNIYDQCQPMIEKIVDPNFSNHWTTKKYTYPNTNFIIKLKAKGNSLYNSKKITGINLSASMWQDRSDSTITAAYLDNLLDAILLTPK